MVDERLKEPATENIEKHHIIPKSLQEKQIVLELFSNYDVGQIVSFNYREHYIAHKKYVSDELQVWNKGLTGENNPQSGKNHPRAIKIVRIDKYGNIKPYDYIKLATKDGFSKVMISNCINNYKTGDYIYGKKFDDYYAWLPTEYFETLTNEDIKQIVDKINSYYKKGMPKFVVKVNIQDNSIIRTYESLTDCGKKHNVTRGSIRKWILTKNPQSKLTALA